MPAGPVEIVNIAPVLTVHARRNASRPCRYARLQRCEITRMHNVRTPSPEQPEELWIKRQRMPWTFIERHVLHVRARDAPAKIVINVGQGHDNMPPCFLRKAVDQVHDAVFQPADGEAVDDVNDQRSRAIDHPGPPRTTASACSIDGDIAATKLRSTLRASSADDSC